MALFEITGTHRHSTETVVIGYESNDIDQAKAYAHSQGLSNVTVKGVRDTATRKNLEKNNLIVSDKSMKRRRSRKRKSSWPITVSCLAAGYGLFAALIFLVSSVFSSVSSRDTLQDTAIILGGMSLLAIPIFIVSVITFFFIRQTASPALGFSACGLAILTNGYFAGMAINAMDILAVG